MRRHKLADKRRLKRPLAKKTEWQRYHAGVRRRKLRRLLDAQKYQRALGAHRTDA
jgi:hypothetical protein